MRAMKDSGVECIGKIPYGKNVLRNKYLLEYVKGKLPQSTNLNKEGLPYIGATYLDTDKDEEIYTTDINLPDAIKEDLLVLWDGARAGLAGRNKEGKISSTIVRIRGNEKTIYQPLLYWYYKGFEEYMYQCVGGTTIPHMNRKYIEDIGFIDWTISEQIKLTSYLDSKCSKIDTIIEKQQAVIEKLKEYKLSVITEAVTKGLNPDVEMKDSGVEWIGEVPKTTTVTRAGHVFDIILGKMLANIPSSETDTMEKYFCAANVHFTGIDYENLKVMWFSEKEKQIYKVNVGDLLVVEGGAGAGGAFVVDRDTEDIYVQNSILIVRSTDNVSAKWLQYSLFALVNRGYIDFVCNKATIPHFTKEKLSDVPVVIFSSVDEKFILNFLDDKCEQINNSIANREQLIDKLREYKKSLIYEVVTGKKEV